MATATQFVNIAMQDLGYKESPANSNTTKFGKWIGLQGQPWCMSAVQYWANNAGVQLPLKTGSCKTLMDAAKRVGQWVTSGYKTGDILIFQWKNGQRHCGIVVSTSDKIIKTIEGNTAVGNDSNGGEVMLRNRTTEFVLGAVRPTFEQEVVNVDYEQFMKLMNEYRSELRDNDSNAYSEEARNWAISTGLIQGNGTILDGQPNYMWEDFLTREQLITVLYRFAKKLGVV